MVTVYGYVSLSIITSSLLEGEEFKLGTFKLVIDPGTNCFYMIMNAWEKGRVGFLATSG
ncbi:protein of unknown function [Paenibacillus alvei]|uniref:Uncharacterized protein n=1 Tax=Paenibacillus alvei TaxID=44250 RepID=A0A383R738_PAEAL|nr:protein of unknown function [Paenibacillus alvei]